MGYADEIFKEKCRRILASKDLIKTRAKWKDEKTGELIPAYTKHIFGVMDRYPLGEGNEFPIMTLRKTNWENALDEILWIYQKQSNKIYDLNSHIWDAWADEDGSIGKAYGWQLGRLYYQKDLDTMMNQVDRARWDLKHDPFSRRIIISMWDVNDLQEMNLQPCAYSLTFNVSERDDGEKVLSAILNQRSQDMLTASNWNVVQYSFLLMLFARDCGMIPGELIHVIGDCHIYDKHLELVEEMISKEALTDVPIIGKDVELNPFLNDFYDARIEDFKVSNYKYLEFNHKIPVAV